MADARHVQFARELEQRDAALAEALATVRALQADVEELRAHAQLARATLERYPDGRAEIEHAVDEARIEIDAREAELAAAEAELASAREGEPELAASRALTRATDAASSARKRVARVEAERDTLEREHARAEADLPRLRARAAELAARLTATPRATSVPVGEDEVDWTSRARAALFVAAGSLETERERVVREANELAAAALGDPASATSVSLVRARIEQAESGGTLPISPS
jgi:chromosome segregation ATPase